MLGRTTPSEQFVPEPSILYLDLVNHQRLPRAGLQLLGSIIMNNRRNSRLVYGNLVPKVKRGLFSEVYYNLGILKAKRVGS